MNEAEQKLKEAGYALLMVFVADRDCARWVVDRARKLCPYVRPDEITALEQLQLRASRIREKFPDMEAPF